MLKVTLQRKRSEFPVWLSHLILTPHSHPYTPQKGGSSFVSQTFHCLFSVLQLGTHNQKQHQVNECSWDRGRGREHSLQVSLWARRQQVNPRILLGPLFLNQLQKEMGQRELGTAQSWVCGLR